MIDHLFFECSYSCKFWEDFEGYWSLLAKEHLKIDLKTVIIISLSYTRCNLLNYLIVLGKLHLWNCRRNNTFPFLSSFIESLKGKCT